MAGIRTSEILPRRDVSAAASGTIEKHKISYSSVPIGRPLEEDVIAMAADLKSKG